MRLKLRAPIVQRYLFAVWGGILLGLAFPNFEVAGFGWVAPGLLMAAGLGLAPSSAFKVGMAGGMGFFLVALYWLLHIPVAFLPILGWIGLSAYLSLYTGLWLVLGNALFPPPPALPNPSASFLRALCAQLARIPWFDRLRWTFLTALTWVGLEMVIARFLTGFPWLTLGMSQYKMLPVLQIAPYTGVYGVSFLMVWFALAMAVAGLLLIAQPVPRTYWVREIGVAGFVLALVLGYGFVQIRQPQPARKTISAALIQPSIPQTLIWDERENTNRFQQLLKLSEDALAHKPDLIIWPEASVPTMIRYDREIARSILSLTRNHKVWLVLGSDDAEKRPGSTDPDDFQFFNSSFAISPQGHLAGDYRKRRLVIFGEYIPFARHLPFLKSVLPAATSGFTPGDRPIPFELPSINVNTSVLICFEDVFPHLAREYVNEETDFLLNLTNNGWFGESAAQWQHAANAVFRAIENRIPLVRCANNGLSCWVDEFGGMHNVHFEKGSIYQAGYKLVQVPVLEPGEKRQLTFYTRHGDVFGWCAVVAAAWALVIHLRQLRCRPQTESTAPIPAN